MRYASRLDYFLFNALFLREGLRLSSFANGIRFWYYRPLAARRCARSGARAPRARAAPDVDAERDRDRARELVARRRSRSSCSCAPSGCARCCAAARRRVAHGRAPSATCSPRWSRRARPADARCSLVPLALFWRKGPRTRAALPEPRLRRADAARPTSRRSPRSSSPTATCASRCGDPIDLTALRRGARAREGARRRRAQGAPLDPAVPVPRGAGGRGAGAAAAPPRAGDRARAARACAPRSSERAREQRVARRPRAPRPRRCFREIAAQHELDASSRCSNFVGRPAIFKRLFASIEEQRPREGRRVREAPPDRAGAEPPLVLRLPDALAALLRAPPGAAAHRGAREHGLRALRLHLPPRGRLLPAQVASTTRSTRRCSAPTSSYLVQRGLHPGVLHRGRALAHRQDAGAAPRHAVLERRGLPRQQPPRSLLRADRDHLRAPGRGGLDGRRARGRREEGREHARPGARAEVPAAPLRQRVRELRRADLAGRGARRPPRAASRRARRRRRGRSGAPSSSGSATRSSSASTGRWSRTRPRWWPARCSASARRGMFRAELTRRMQRGRRAAAAPGRAAHARARRATSRDYRRRDRSSCCAPI